MKIKKAAQHIRNGFLWHETDEGWYYWRNVYWNLITMAGVDGTKQSTIGKTKKRVCKAIDIIRCEFEWSETPQGCKYWSDVVDKLRRIRDEA